MKLRNRPVLVLSAAVALSTLFVPVPGQPEPAERAPSKKPRPVAEAAPVPKPAGVPVTFHGTTLFEIYSGIGSFTPRERAEVIEERLVRLSQDPQASLDDVRVSDVENLTVINAGDVVIMAVTDGDAGPSGRRRQEVAKDYAGRIQRGLASAHHETSLRAILLGALFSLLATIALIVALKLFQRLFPKVYAMLDGWRGTWIRSVKIQQVEVVSADRIADILLGLAKAVRVAAVVLVVYFYLTTVLSFFPWTRGLAKALFSYFVTPLIVTAQAFAAQIPNLISIVVIVFVARYSIKLVRLIFVEIERGVLTFPGFDRDWAMPTYKIVRFLMIAFAAIAVFPYIPGSNSPAFQGISVFLGVLFSLGSTGAVSNVVAGVILTYMRPFQLCDRVKIADTTGDIIERTLLVTRIRTIKNVDITIPNSIILGAHIINYSSSAQEHGLILHTSVTIGYDAPWRKVHELLINAARATTHILKEPAPFVLQTSLDDFYVTYELNAYTDQPNKMAVIYAELHQNIQDKFNEGGVEIMSPHYSALRDGNQTTIPEGYLPKTYRPRTFRIAQPDGSDKGSQP